MKKTVDVILPVYRPDEKFRENLSRLAGQTYSINRIIIMNTDEAFWIPEYISGYGQAEVHHVTKREFDHGGTRRAAAALSDADILVFLTQDAVPYGPDLIEKLAEKLQIDGVKAAYARQLPGRDAGILESYARTHNYPPISRIKSRSDLPSMGIRTFFCSNVCAAYDRAVYEELGGFVERTIFNEDMIYAANLIGAGYRIAYAADACVVHFHDYNCRQQFHRNFDLGVSQAEHPEVFARYPSEGEGVSFVLGTARHLLSVRRPDLLIPLFFQSAAKYAGYFLGKRFRRLPRGLILRCTSNREYWT